MTFEETVICSYPTGSRYICNPPPQDTDNDTVILVNGYYDWAQLLLNEGWEDCGQYDQGGDFRAFRKGEENYIVTEEDNFFLSYVKATEGARALNLLDKDQRIALFQAILQTEDGFTGLYGADHAADFIIPALEVGDRDDPAMFRVVAEAVADEVDAQLLQEADAIPDAFFEEDDDVEIRIQHVEPVAGNRQLVWDGPIGQWVWADNA